MTVAVEDTKETFTGDGATLQWPFNFKVNDPADLHVFTVSIEGVESSLALGADYTVTLHANQNSNPGGFVTTDAPIPAGVPGVIMRDMSFTRVNEFDASVPPHIIEEELDRLTMYALQLRERLDRSLHVSAATQEFADVNLRNVPARRNKIIGFDDSDRANAILLELRGDTVVGPQGVTRVSRVEVDAPAVFRQDINGDWSHTSCTVTFIWSANSATEQTRSIAIELDEANSCFLEPDPVAGITVTQDAGKLLTKISSTFGGVTDYIQLAVIRMADPVYATDSFSPTWAAGDFSVAPVGVVGCKNAAGLVTMTVAAAREATSTADTMAWDAGSVPAAFRPDEPRFATCKLRYNATLTAVGGVTINPDGSAVFALFNGATGGFSASGWQTGEAKGLPADWCVSYPL